MMKHNYFGKIIEDEWASFHPEKETLIPYFDKKIRVYLGAEYDEDGEEMTTPPTPQQLDEFAQTLERFLTDIDKVIIDIQQSAFDYYQRIYARYYEKPFEVIFENSKVQKCKDEELHPPLNIDTKEKHFEYMKGIVEGIRIWDNQTLKIPIRYDLDEEHGMEVKIENNKVIAVGGIATT
ncbi:hypothetical protein AAG747_04735 [Rapidithrix thailandica]|uniref:DUF6985 domain-containing protein n=1 Tax=Rapidithrix thailandica TaxID=413964 RepID=A0AAW9S271_9BACT